MSPKKRTASLRLRDRTSHQDRTSNRREDIYIWTLSLVYTRHYTPLEPKCLLLSVVVESAHLLCSFVSDGRNSMRALSFHTRWVQLRGVVLALPLGSALNVDETGIKCTPERYIPQYCPLVIWVRGRVNTGDQTLADSFAWYASRIPERICCPSRDRAQLWSQKKQFGPVPRWSQPLRGKSRRFDWAPSSCRYSKLAACAMMIVKGV